MKKILNQNKKVAVISGGDGYLGKIISKKLAENNFEVVAISRNSGVDITDPKIVQKLAEKMKKKFGQINVLIHAASAPIIRKPILEQSENEFNSQLAVNVLGGFHLFKYFAPLLTHGGAIVGISSRAIEPGHFRSSSGSYIPAKFALNGLLRVLSNELKDQSIIVCSVAPAFMAGGMNDNIPDLVREFISRKSKPENVTTPQEVAKVIFKLIRAPDKTMNGKSITVPSGIITDL